MLTYEWFKSLGGPLFNAAKQMLSIESICNTFWEKPTQTKMSRQLEGAVPSQGTFCIAHDVGTNHIISHIERIHSPPYSFIYILTSTFIYSYKEPESTPPPPEDFIPEADKKQKVVPKRLYVHIYPP